MSCLGVGEPDYSAACGREHGSRRVEDDASVKSVTGLRSTLNRQKLPRRPSRTLLYWLPAAALALLIFILSSTPSTQFPDVDLPNLDKLIHMGVYGLLAACVAFALQGAHGLSKRFTLVATATCIAALYGVSDEWHQSFVPSRSPELLDLVADFVGAAIASICYASLLAHRLFVKSPSPEMQRVGEVQQT